MSGVVHERRQNLEGSLEVNRKRREQVEAVLSLLRRERETLLAELGRLRFESLIGAAGAVRLWLHYPEDYPLCSLNNCVGTIQSISGSTAQVLFGETIWELNLDLLTPTENATSK